MSNEALIDLGHRAVTCAGWKWVSGMQPLAGLEQRIPDFSDPAIQGCLRILLREVWKEPLLHTIPMIGGGWRVVGFLHQRDDSIGAHGSTEEEAMVQALEKHMFVGHDT